MKRREFMASACGSAVAGLLTGAGALAHPARGRSAKGHWPARWGLQLFTVGALLETDFDGTLRQVAAAGYGEVETVGSFGRDPHRLRDALNRFGLRSPSQHIASDAVYASFGAWTRREITTEQNRANYERALAPDNVLALVRDGIAKAKVLGQTYVVWPILMPGMLTDRATLDRYIGLFNQAGALCRDEGLVFAFHNHHREFQRLGSDVIYDLILAGTDPALVRMEMDFYWFAKAGADPLAYLAGHPGRYFGCHLKDMDQAGEITTVGAGRLPITRLLGAARRAGVEHIYVEYDRSDDPLAAIKASMTYLEKQA